MFLENTKLKVHQNALKNVFKTGATGRDSAASERSATRGRADQHRNPAFSNQKGGSRTAQITEKEGIGQ